MKREVEDCPELLPYGAKAIMLNLIEIQDPYFVLETAQYMFVIRRRCPYQYEQA